MIPQNERASIRLFSLSVSALVGLYSGVAKV